MTISLSSYSTGTVSVTKGSATITLAGDDAAWPSSWCVPGCQVVIAGESQTNYIAEWTDENTVKLALPVARETASDLSYSILITAPAFATNLEGALTNIERIRLMAENAALQQLLAVSTGEGITPSRSDKLALWDDSDASKVKAVTAAALQRMATGIMAKAADYEVAGGDEGKLITVSAGGAARTITLPSAATVGTGFTVGIKKTDTSTNTVTIAAAGGETIDGDASTVLAQTFDVVWLRSDGTNWQVVGERISVTKGVRYDAFVETDEDLSTYDDKPGPTETEPGFSVLVADYSGDGRAAIVSKLSDDSADWSDPAYLTPAIDITADPVDVVDFGTDPSAALTSDGAGGYTLSLSLPKSADLVGVTVTTLAPGEDATASLTAAEGGYTLALGLPKGDTGTISGLTTFWQDIVATKETAEASREALEVASFNQTLQFYSVLALEQAEDRSGGPVLAGPDGNGIFDGFNTLDYVDVAGASGLDTSESGVIKPDTSAETVGHTDDPSDGDVNIGGVTLVDLTYALTNGKTVEQIKLYSDLAVAASLKIVKRNSAGNYDVVYSQAFAHPGSGWATMTLTTPHPIPNDGDYHVALYYAASQLIPRWTTAADRAAYSGDADGSGLTFSETNGSMFSTNAVLSGADDLSVSSIELDLGEAPDWARILAFVDLAGAVLGTDLFFDVTRDGASWETLTMTQGYSRPGGSVVLDSGLTALAAASGTTGRWRVRTANGAAAKILAVGIQFGVD